MSTPHPSVQPGALPPDRRPPTEADAPVRVPALDGLRALAVALVVGLHAGVPLMAGGSLGVTVFFVLSGFLITGLLVRPGALTPGGVRRFYLRRVLRLFPALVVVVGFVTAYALVALEGEERRFQLLQALTSITYTTNFLLGRGAETEDYGLLGQTWSLGVEEQYYLVWPLLLAVLLRLLRSTRARVAAVLAMAAVVVSWRAWLSSQGLAAHVGMGVDTQTDGLLVGSALALALPALRERLLRHQGLLTAAAVAGVLLLLVETAVVSLHHALPYDTNYLLVALASAAVITRLVLPGDDEGGPAHRALLALATLRPVVYVGLISYPLYLWHRVVFEVMADQAGIETTVEKLAAAPVALGLSLGVAALSYHVVEQPFLRRKELLRGDPTDRAQDAAVASPSPATVPAGTTGTTGTAGRHRRASRAGTDRDAEGRADR